MSLLVVFLTQFSDLSALAENAVKPADLLKSSDRGRGGLLAGVKWDAKVTSVEGDQKSSREFVVSALGDDAYVEAVNPPRNKGEVYIFNNREMWFFRPSLKKPISISPRQKLMGQASNGDIASTQYFRDYTPEIETTKEVEGKKYHVLLLTAKSKNVTYDKIRYWIEVKSQLALKAEFLTSQGKAFKYATLEYANNLVIKGVKTPFISKLTIVDAKYTDHKSVIEYIKPESKKLSDSLFDVSNLTR